MAQIARKWIEDGAVDNTKIDSTASYTIAGLTATANATVGGTLGVSSRTTTQDLSVTRDATFSGHTEFIGTVGGIDMSTAEDLYVGGRIGIATNNPQASLHTLGSIIGNANGSSNLGSATNRWANIYMASTIDVATSSDLNFVQDSTSRVIIKDVTGRIGIGIENPQQSLHVLGAIQASGAVLSGTSVYASNSVYALNSAGQNSYIGCFKGQGSLPGYPTEYYPVLKTDFSYIFISTEGKYSGYIGGTTDAKLVLNDTNTLAKIYLDTNGSSYFTGGSVGIGTTAPGTILHLNTTSGDTILRIQNSDGVAGSRRWELISNSGGNFSIYDRDSNAGRVMIDTLGNIGIGVTNTVYKLQISSGSAGTWIGGNSSGVLNVNAEGDFFSGGGTVVNISCEAVSGTDYYFLKCIADRNGTPTTKFSIFSNGVVTASYGNFVYTSTASAGEDVGNHVILVNTAAYDSGTDNSVAFEGYYNAVPGTATFAAISGTKENITINNWAGCLKFLTRVNGSGAPTEKMRITSNGNVGIGTMNPVCKFVVDLGTNRSVGIGTIPGNASASYFTDFSALGGAIGISRAVDGNQHHWLFGYDTATSKENIAISSRSEIVFGVQGMDVGTNGYEAMRITDSRRVGIGTTNPQHKLHVQGAIQVSDSATTCKNVGLKRTPFFPLGKPRIIDLTTEDADLKGLHGGFTDGRYGYFVPYYNGSYNGKVARVDLNDFSTVSVLNLASTDSDLKGFYGGFTDGRYGYFVPYNNGSSHFGKVVRVDLNDFSTVSVLNLASTDSDLKGFHGGFTDGRYGYFVPDHNGSSHFGKVARVDLNDFSTVSVLNLASTDADLKGFIGGFTDGRYGYFVPNYNGSSHSGKVVRVDLNDFSTVSVLNLASTDADLKGFYGGFTDGRYGYFVPHYNGSYYGKVARVDLNDFSTVSVLNLASTDADLKGFIGGFTDGRYGYFVPHYNGSYHGKVARILVNFGCTINGNI
jgi:hypothetical protein